MFSQDIQEEISLAVIKVLLSRFGSFPKDGDQNRNAPFHEAFLNAFSEELNKKIPNIPYFISLSSWLHGLSTSLGQSFFERIAHVLSAGEKKDFTNTQHSLLIIRTKQNEVINEIMTDLQNGNIPPSLSREHNLLLEASQQGKTIDANNFTADVFFERNEQMIAIELKTVKPNAGIMRGEKQKILKAKSALLIKYPNHQINFYIGFPFDPNSSAATEYNKAKFLKTIVDGEKYFAPEEVLLANELWEFLSGEKDAMQQILDIINAIATKDFMENYTFLANRENRKKTPLQYKELLKKWFLFSELELLENDLQIQEKAKGRDKTKYNQSMFHSDGKYKRERYTRLISLVK